MALKYSVMQSDENQLRLEWSDGLRVNVKTLEDSQDPTRVCLRGVHTTSEIRTALYAAIPVLGSMLQVLDGTKLAEGKWCPVVSTCDCGSDRELINPGSIYGWSGKPVAIHLWRTTHPTPVT